jgi:putative phosphoesterase
MARGSGESMIVGIMSDSHGKYERVRAACALFDTLGAKTLIHCGDVGRESVFDEVVGRDFRFVWGNTDEPDGPLRAHVQTLGLRPPLAVPLVVQLEGKTLHVFHGHEPEFHSALRYTTADYILHGHTHSARDERIAGARVINPGALHRAPQYTVATLDLANDAVRFHEVR